MGDLSDATKTDGLVSKNENEASEQHSPNDQAPSSVDDQGSKTPASIAKKDQVESPKTSFIQKLASFMKSPLKKAAMPCDTPPQSSEDNGSSAEQGQTNDQGQDPLPLETNQSETSRDPGERPSVTNSSPSKNAQDPAQMDVKQDVQPTATGANPSLLTPMKEGCTPCVNSDCSGITGCFGAAKRSSPPYGESPKEGNLKAQQTSSSPSGENLDPSQGAEDNAELPQKADGKEAEKGSEEQLPNNSESPSEPADAVKGS